MLLDAIDVALVFALTIIGALSFVGSRRLRNRHDVKWRRLKAASLLFLAFGTLIAAIIGLVSTQIAKDEHPRDTILFSAPFTIVIAALAAAGVALRPEFPDLYESPSARAKQDGGHQSN